MKNLAWTAVALSLVFSSCGFEPGGLAEDGELDSMPPDAVTDTVSDAGEVPDEGNVDDFPYPEPMMDSTVAYYGLMEGVEELCSCGNLEGIIAVVYDENAGGCYFFAEKECDSHADCNDGAYCNTEERCGRFEDSDTGHCYTACCPDECTPCDPPAGDHPECTPALCVEEQRACLYPPKDSDRDGYVDAACGGDDCDDDLPSVHPGLPDLCGDGGTPDNNCNLISDEDGWTVPAGLADGGSISETDEPGDTRHTLASFGSTWQAAWLDRTGAIRFADTDGVLPAASSVVQDPDPDMAVGNISILGSEGLFFLVWTEAGPEGSRILMKSVSSSPAAPASIVYAGAGPGAEIDDLAAKVWTGPDTRRAGLFFKMATTEDGANYEIFYLALADFTAAVPPDLEPVRITTSIGFSGHPDMAAIAAGWLVAWEDERDGNRQIYLTKVDVAGAHLTANAVRITATPGDSQEPRIACLAGNPRCGLVWSDERYGNFAIFGTTLSHEDLVPEPEISLTGADQSAWFPALAPDFDRGQFFVAYSLSDRVNASDIVLNFTAQGLASALDGTYLEQGEIQALEPLLAPNEDGRLAVLWKQVDRGESSLHLKILACP
jgi:hypothetical protein